MQDEVAGDPVDGQGWIRRSLGKIRQALAELGFTLCCQTRRLLHKHRIRPQSNVKRLKGDPHPDRDQPFTSMERQRHAFAWMGQLVISADTKKKELIGPFRNPGQVGCEQASPVNSYDFPTWSGTPLTSFDRVLDGIRQTTTGLTVNAALIAKTYATGLKVSDEALASLALERHATCPAWNDTIHP